MKNVQPKPSTNRPESAEERRMPLSRRNYVWILVGVALILVGFILMSGGGSDVPDHFNYAMFSWRRITLAPILVIAGFGVEIYAILKRYE